MVDFLPSGRPDKGYRDNAKPSEKTLDELEKEAVEAKSLLNMEIAVFDLAEKMFLSQNWTGNKIDDIILYSRKFLEKRDKAVLPLQRASNIAREAYRAKEAKEAEERRRERNKAPGTGCW